MENEIKDKAVLTDEELKAVAGGAMVLNNVNSPCEALGATQCKAKKVCKWTNGKCVANTKNS